MFFDKNDTQPVSSFTAQTNNQTTPGGLYIEMAQHNAIDEALSSAGFGIQFVPANESRRPLVSESEIPKVEAKPIVEETTVKVEELIEEVVAHVPEIVEQVVTPIVEEKIEEAPIAEAVAEAPVEEAPIDETVEATPILEEPAPAVDHPEPAVVTPVHEVTEIQEDESNLSYNKSMSVEEICALMTVEEARNYVVPVGTCKNWTMDQVASRRPVSLKYYLSPAYTGDDNILRAAATIMLRLTQNQAA